MIKINGTLIKTPSKVSIGIYDVSKTADRNAEGTILIDRVAVKRKIEMEWGALSGAEISSILSSVKEVFFPVTFPDPESGMMKTITCYSGDRTSPMARFTLGVPLWEGLKMNLIEQ